MTAPNAVFGSGVFTAFHVSRPEWEMDGLLVRMSQDGTLWDFYFIPKHPLEGLTLRSWSPSSAYAEGEHTVEAAKHEKTQERIILTGRLLKPKLAHPQQWNTPEFKAWFAGSKVVDKQGNPLRCFHGTTAEFDTFDPSAADRRNPYPGGTSGASFFTSCPESASGYAGKERLVWSERYRPGGRIIPVYLKIINPLKVDARGENWQDIQYRGNYYTIPELVDLAKRKGNDGVIVSNVFDNRNAGEKATTYAVFSSNQIQQAIGNKFNQTPK